MNQRRIYLSPPNTGAEALNGVKQALDSGWLAPIGPSLDAFEIQLSSILDNQPVLALNSGTAALHLSLVLAGVGPGDRVLVGSFTFAACANVVLYQGAVPVFIDSEEETWNLDPQLLSGYLETCKEKPRALIVTHLFGMPADIEMIVAIAKEHGVIVIEDAAESLGSQRNDIPVGTLGDYGVLSFNGNKIVTTTSGGALICNADDRKRALHLATQANSDRFGYHHEEVGYNYRLSNVLAGLGISQLNRLQEFIDRKRTIYRCYHEALSERFDFLPEPEGCFSNRWLTTCLLPPDGDAGDLISYLDGKGVESRMLWKPLHLHPAYSRFEFIGAGIAERIYHKGICLPSGSGLTDGQQETVIALIKEWLVS